MIWSFWCGQRMWPTRNGVVTTVHGRQVRTETWDVDDHDVPMDYVVTPERTVETGASSDRPAGIDWDALSAERVEKMPVLRERKP